MNALEQARMEAESHEQALKEFDEGSAEWHLKAAAVYAAIAQAEQLKRIADALEKNTVDIVKAIHSNNQYN